MEHKSTVKIIALLGIIIIFVLLFRNLINTSSINRRLNQIEGEQQTFKENLEKVESLLQTLNEKTNALKMIQAPKDSQLGNNSSDLPISPTTMLVTEPILSNPYLGDASSPLTIYAFLDYQCVPCRQFYHATFAKLKVEYIDTKKAKFVFRDFPLSSNANSIQAAKFARCAGEQGYYWEAFNSLFTQYDAVDMGKFADIAHSIKNLNEDKLRSCIDDPVRYSGDIEKDSASGKKLGAKGAPTFFIAKNTANSSEISGVLIRGAQPFQVIKHQIENLLYQHRNSH